MDRSQGPGAILGLLLLMGAAVAGPPAKIRRDRNGDPLPPHALARLGAVRPLHQGGVDVLAFAPDGKLLASAGRDHTIRLWNAEGKELRRLAGQHDVCSLHFTPDARALIAVAGPAAGTVGVFETATGRALRRWPGPKDGCLRAALAPDGKSLATVGPYGEVSLWEAQTGKDQRLLQGRLSGPALALAFSPDGQTVWTADSDGEALAWTTRTGKQTRRFRFKERPAAGLLCAAFSARGRLAVTGRTDNTTVTLWDLATARAAGRFQVHQGRAITALAFTADGQRLASAGDEAVVYLSDAAGKSVGRFSGHLDRVGCLAVSPDGKILASGSDDGAVRLWDVTAGKERRRDGPGQDPVASLACAPDGRTVATGTTSGIVHVWDVKTGQELRRLRGHRDSVECVAFSPDGGTLATGSKDGTVWLWEPRRGAGRLLGGYGPRVLCVAFAPDGRSLAVGGGVRGRVSPVQLWDIGTGTLIRELPGHDHGVLSIAFLPGGETLVSAGGDRVVHFSSVGTGAPHRNAEKLVGADSHVALAADGNTAASVELNGSIHLWESLTGKFRGHIPDSAATRYCIAVSPDGRLLAAAGWGGTVGLWDAASGKKVHQFAGHQHHVYALTFSPDGRTLISGSLDGTALLWDVTGLAPPLPARQPAPGELEALWADLTGTNAVKAYRALWRLVAARHRAARFLHGRLTELSAPSLSAIVQHVAALDDDRFKVRQAAEEQLERWGTESLPALQRALAGKPSVEQRLRAERLLQKIKGDWPSRSRLCGCRGIEVLEKMGTAESRAVLADLGKGPERSWLAWEAVGALQRLKKLGRPAPFP